MGYIDFAVSTLKLFKALPITDVEVDNDINEEQLIKNGIFLQPEVRKFSKLDETIMKTIYNMFSVNLKNTFHATFDKVANANMEQLVFEQLLHYMTTYGAEAAGVTGIPVYIPNEKIDAIKDVDKDIFKVVSISGITNEEIYIKLEKMLYSGIALSADTLNNIDNIIEYCNFTFDVDRIANKEFKCKYCLKNNMVPRSVKELLRLINYVFTDNTILINNNKTRSNWATKIVSGQYTDKINNILNEYVNRYGERPLADSFFRFKKLFLCIKNSGNSSLINKIKRMAEKHHIVYKKPLLERITSDNNIDIPSLIKELKNITLFKKISLLNALSYRMNDNSIFAYKVRNGALYIKDSENVNNNNYENIYNVILTSVADQVNNIVAGKKIYIPKNINYAFPTSEKSFFGGIPYGSEYILGEDPTLIAVHWENIVDENSSEEIMIDLDLHAQDNKGNTIGWDGWYRREDRTVLYSGDMTTAPIAVGGATEALYFNKINEDGYLITLNFFNKFATNLDSMDFDFIIGNTDIVDMVDDDVTEYDKHLIEASKVAVHIPLTINAANNLLGFIKKVDDKYTFTFMNYMFGSSCRCVYGKLAEKLNKYMFNYGANQLKLLKILGLCDVKFVDNPEDADVDLSLEKLSKTSILDLIIR